MTVPALPALSRATLDRDAALREDPEALAAAWEQAQVLVVDRGRALVEPDGPALVLVDAATAEGLATGEERVYLGSDGSSPYFAVTGQLPRRLGCRPQDLREVGALLPARDAGLMAHAVGSLAIGTASQAGLASTLSLLAGAGLGVEWLREHPKALASVSVEEVLASAQRWLAPGRLTAVLVGDADEIADPVSGVLPLERA